MNAYSVVVLWGGSLLLAGLEASLRARPELRVVRLAASRKSAMKHLQALQPDAVIFDSDDRSQRDWPNLTRLLKDNPHALVIALGAGQHELVVLSSQQRTADNLDDVIAAIRHHSGDSEDGITVPRAQGQET